MSSRSAEGTGTVTRIAKAAGQTIWVLIPVLSMSFLAFVPAVQIYWRARTIGWLVSAAALVATVAGIAVGLSLDADGAGFGFLIIAAAGGGVVAAAVGRPIVFGHREPTVDPAVEQVLEDRERRERSREIAANDPAMALELGIGRPELHNAYADGGLVDLNNATADGIMRVLGWAREMAEGFVAERDARHGYASLTEIAALSSLDPTLLEHAADRIVVLPHRRSS